MLVDAPGHFLTTRAIQIGLPVINLLEHRLQRNKAIGSAIEMGPGARPAPLPRLPGKPGPHRIKLDIANRL